MKNKYESPIAEKIKFNYRDQVVAASGGEENIENGTNTSNPVDEFFRGVAGLGSFACDNAVGFLYDIIGSSTCS